MRIVDNVLNAISFAPTALSIRSSISPREVPPHVGQRVENARQMPAFSPEFVAHLMEQIREKMHELIQTRRDEAASDPELSSRVPDAEYAAVDAELFGADGPRIEDIEQGGIGDCYFLAAVGALAANDPDAIRDMIRDNGDGTYSVRFYDNGKPVWIHVDGELPVDANGNLVYAKGVDSDGDNQLEIWVGLLEKAYAKFRDKVGSNADAVGYDEIDEGGHSDTVMKALTGQSAERFGVLGGSDEFASALGAANDGTLMTIQTKANAGDGWVANHVYTVVGTYERDGETYVILRNPHGRGEPDGSEPLGEENDGTFAVPAHELRGVTRRVYSGEPPQEPPQEPVRKGTPWDLLRSA